MKLTNESQKPARSQYAKTMSQKLQTRNMKLNSELEPKLQITSMGKSWKLHARKLKDKTRSCRLIENQKLKAIN